MPLPNRSVENLVHFNCPFCQKWWSVGDAPEDKEVWWCPWCGKRLSEEKAQNLGPFLAHILPEEGQSYYQMVRLDPETGLYIPENDEKFYLNEEFNFNFRSVCIDPSLLPKIEWR